MPHVVKYLLVLAVLMSGFYMARMFRVPQSADVGVETPAENETTDLPTLGEDAGAHVVSDQLPVAALADVDRASVAVVDDFAKFGSREPVDQTGADTGRRPLDGQPTVRRQGGPKRQRPHSDYSQETRRGATYDNAVPDFAADYKPWLEPLEESAQPDAKPVESYERSDLLDEAYPGDQQDEHDHVVRHRVVEGDTLRRLAERYLGDRERYLDLYEANGDVLFHPRLLPIGIEIVIPDQPNTFLAGEGEDSDDLTAQSDPWEDEDGRQSGADTPYSPWGEY